MLKVILNHWQNQRQRPQSTLPILTPSDEEIVTKVNPIFDDDREDENDTKDTTSSTKEEDLATPGPSVDKDTVVPRKAVVRPKVVFSTSGFDSLDSRDDPVGAIVTDVVAEVHRPDSTSLPRTLAPNKEEEDATSIVEEAVHDTDPSEYFNQARKQSGQPSFLHYSYTKLKQASVLKRKDKEPRSSIFNFTNSPSDEPSPLKSILKDHGKEPEVTPVPEPITNSPSEPSLSKDSESVPLENNYSELNKAGPSKPTVTATGSETAPEESPISIPPLPPPLPPTFKVDKATYTRLEKAPFPDPGSSESTEKLGNDVKKPQPLSHAEILKQAMLVNTILKPSEIAKREKESRAAAARERGDILPRPPIAIPSRTPVAIPEKKAPTEPELPQIVPKIPTHSNFKKPPQMSFPKPPPVEKSQPSSLETPNDDRPPPDEEISVSAAKPSENTEVKKPLGDSVAYTSVNIIPNNIKTTVEEKVKGASVKAARSNSITRAENSVAAEAERRETERKTPPKNLACRKCDRLHDPAEPCPNAKPEGKKSKKGVTRGDQIGSDEGNSSSVNSSGSRSSLPGPSKQRSDGDGGREKRPKSPKICRHCFMHGRRSMRMKRPLTDLGKYDDYYLAAIQGSRSHKFSADSLSDFSTDPYDRHHHTRSKRKHHRRQADFSERPFSRQARGGFRSPTEGGRYPPEGSTHDSLSDGFDEDFLDKFPYRRTRRFSWGSCSCDQCSEASSFTFEKRPKSFGEADEDKVKSLRGKPNNWHHSVCTCGHNAQNGRRVQFQEKSNGTANGVKAKSPEDDKGTTTKDGQKEGEEIEREEESKEDKKAGVEKKGSEKESSLKNGRPNGVINGYPQYPWEIEDWELYLQKRYVVRKRRRALYMGIFALVLIVVAGMTVGLVMVWLRKTAPAH